MQLIVFETNIRVNELFKHNGIILFLSNDNAMSNDSIKLSYPNLIENGFSAIKSHSGCSIYSVVIYLSATASIASREIDTSTRTRHRSTTGGHSNFLSI